MWLPRLSGPIDLRWDGGVYYLLGTSLAQGHGYRIPSEPGSPEALQYPPLLPAIVAVYQRALGTTDPAVVGEWLRKTYAALFVVYSLAVFALARRYLEPGYAVIAAAVCLLQGMTIFLSDLLFAELPFAMISVVFAIVAAKGSRSERPWLRELLSYGLAAAGFLLRTAGLALLAAWVLQALVQRRWWLAVGRGALALLPIIAWQAYVLRVRASEQYAHPAYEYQRAPYQYYNVSYAENVGLLDPFRPELGRMKIDAFVARLATNLPTLLEALGEELSSIESEWRQIFEKAQGHLFGKPFIPGAIVRIPIFFLTGLVLAGAVLLLRRGAWMIPLILSGSVALVWMTPWPAQYARYLMPLAPFLAICLILALSTIMVTLHGSKYRSKAFVKVTFGAFFFLVFVVETWTSLKLFRVRVRDGAIVRPANSASYRLFAHHRKWQDWEEAVKWIEAHSVRDAIVATSAPHFLYLSTGLRAVLPPMAADPVRARQLLEAVPVTYVIVDDLEFLDISRRYARPAVESDPLNWRIIQSIEDTTIYEQNPQRR